MEKEYVERRPEGYYVAGTRVSLASVVLHFRQGASPEGILQKFPALSSLENVYGAILFYLANEQVVETYLAEQERRWREFEHTADPPPPELSHRIDYTRGERTR